MAVCNAPLVAPTPWRLVHNSASKILHGGHCPAASALQTPATQLRSGMLVTPLPVLAHHHAAERCPLRTV